MAFTLEKRMKQNCKRRVFQLLFIGLALFFQASTGSARSEDDGSRILIRTVETYRQLDTYRDVGTVTSISTTGDTESREVREFETLFVREPFNFRFRYQEVGKDDSTYLILARGETVDTHWKYEWVPNPEYDSTEKSLPDALSAATGVSRGSSRRVPGLLLDQEILAGWGLEDLVEVRLGADDIIDGAETYRLQADLPGEGRGPITLWIDKSSFLIRKIEEKSQPGKTITFRVQGEEVDMKDLTVHHLTEYKPKANVEIGIKNFDVPIEELGEPRELVPELLPDQKVLFQIRHPEEARYYKTLSSTSVETVERYAENFSVELTMLLKTIRERIAADEEDLRMYIDRLIELYDTPDLPMSEEAWRDIRSRLRGTDRVYEFEYARGGYSDYGILVIRDGKIVYRHPFGTSYRGPIRTTEGELRHRDHFERPARSEVDFDNL